MREFEYIFDVGLLKGIGERRQYVVEQTLEECHNFKPIGQGLVAKESIEFPASLDVFRSVSDVERDLGFPRIVDISNKCYLLDYYSPQFNPFMGAVYIVNKSTNILGQRFGVTSYPDLADFGKFTVITSKGESYLSGVYSDDFSNTNQLNIDHSLGYCCCNFRGQLVSSSSRYAIWSNIGDVSFNKVKNTSGDIYIPSGNDVGIVGIKEVDSGIVIATFDGIWALIPVVSPVSTYGLRRIYPSGVQTVRAIESNNKEALLITSDGKLLYISGDFQVKEFDFSHLFGSEAHSIVYSKVDNLWYISSSKAGYCFNPQFGLSSINQAVTGIYSDALIGCGKVLNECKGIIQTAPFDLGYSGIKTITGIEIGKNLGIAYVSVLFRANQKEKWKESKSIRLNNFNAVGFPVAGSEFKIRLEVLNPSEANIDYIKVRWKMSDLRNLRGVYSPPPRGQYAS